MIRNNRLRAATLGFGLALLSTSLLAAPVVTVASDPTSGSSLSPDVATARGTFVGQLDQVQGESFSGATDGTLADPQSLTIFDGQGTLTPSYSDFATYRVRSNPGTSGRFDTTCLTAQGACSPRWFEAQGTFRVDFGGAFNAFGFYGTDISDFYGKLQVELIRSDGALTLLDELMFPESPLTGGLLFFGVLDEAASYTGANIYITQTDEQGGIDYFGFDDLVLGQVARDPNPMPEPGSLALVGASLLALTAARRRRSGRHQV
ncbi:MAG: PEP-CTERM sorting domain-containing protein [Burkholderiaceae bacterium]|nr:PEP-CTERM sorting domain-containing protein [Burkholderiaceae bacterium]